jgi:hypothetical protein
MGHVKSGWRKIVVGRARGRQRCSKTAILTKEFEALFYLLEDFHETRKHAIGAMPLLPARVSAGGDGADRFCSPQQWFSGRPARLSSSSAQSAPGRFLPEHAPFRNAPPQCRHLLLVDLVMRLAARS